MHLRLASCGLLLAPNDIVSDFETGLTADATSIFANVSVEVCRPGVSMTAVEMTPTFAFKSAS